jgi:hypothetical protein
MGYAVHHRNPTPLAPRSGSILAELAVLRGRLDVLHDAVLIGGQVIAVEQLLAGIQDPLVLSMRLSLRDELLARGIH